MKTIKLMAEYECFPLWHDSPNVGNIDPAELPISAGMIERLHEWAARFDGTLSRDEPTLSEFSTAEEANSFASEGRELRRMLQKGLAGIYAISHVEYRDIWS